MRRPTRPFILELEERLSAVLRTAGFLQVHTPIILSRARLEKMGVFDGSIMEKQVFWIDSKRCLRPMLAPHLYEYMREVGRLRPRPVRLFEVGPCFRRETQGQRHANEFTMLNLVEMGLPEGTDLNARLRELGAMVLDAAGIEGWRMTDEDSAVYGETSDFVDKNGMELASSALGPHPLDAAWGIMENWVGIGFGLERLTMAATRGKHDGENRTEPLLPSRDTVTDMKAAICQPQMGKEALLGLLSAKSEGERAFVFDAARKRGTGRSATRCFCTASCI